MTQNTTHHTLPPLTLLLLTLTLLPTLQTNAQPKIATINMKTVFDGYWKTEQANIKFETSKKDADAAHQKMIEKYKNANQTYRTIKESTTEPALSETEKTRRTQQAEQQLQTVKQIEHDIATHLRSMEAALTEQHNRIRTDLLRQIRQTITAQAQAGGYTLVLDTAAESINQIPFILYHDNTHDLTQQTLTQLNAAAPTQTQTQTQTQPNQN